MNHVARRNTKEMVGSFQQRCKIKWYFVVAFLLMSTRFVEISASVSSPSLYASLLAVNSPKTSVLSEVKPTLNSWANSALSTSKNVLKFFNSSAISVVLHKPSRSLNYSSQNRPSSKSSFSTTSVLTHARSSDVKVVTTPIATLPSSSGIVTSPILPSRASSLEQQRNHSTFVASVLSFTKRKQHSEDRRLNSSFFVNYGNGSSSIWSVASTPKSDSGANGSRYNARENITSSLTPHSTTVRHSTVPTQSTNTSNDGKLRTGNYLSGTSARLDSTRSSDVQTKTGHGIVLSINRSRTMLKSSTAELVQSVKHILSTMYLNQNTTTAKESSFTSTLRTATRLIPGSSVQPMSRDQSFGTKTTQAVLSLTQSMHYSLDKSSIRTPMPWNNSSSVNSAVNLSETSRSQQVWSIASTILSVLVGATDTPRMASTHSINGTIAIRSIPLVASFSPPVSGSEQHNEIETTPISVWTSVSQGANSNIQRNMNSTIERFATAVASRSSGGERHVNETSTVHSDLAGTSAIQTSGISGQRNMNETSTSRIVPIGASYTPIASNTAIQTSSISGQRNMSETSTSRIVPIGASYTPIASNTAIQTSSISGQRNMNETSTSRIVPIGASYTQIASNTAIKTSSISGQRNMNETSTSRIVSIGASYTPIASNTAIKTSSISGQRNMNETSTSRIVPIGASYTQIASSAAIQTSSISGQRNMNETSTSRIVPIGASYTPITSNTAIQTSSISGQRNMNGTSTSRIVPIGASYTPMASSDMQYNKNHTGISRSVPVMASVSQLSSNSEQHGSMIPNSSYPEYNTGISTTTHDVPLGASTTLIANSTEFHNMDVSSTTLGAPFGAPTTLIASSSPQHNMNSTSATHIVAVRSSFTLMANTSEQLNPSTAKILQSDTPKLSTSFSRAGTKLEVSTSIRFNGMSSSLYYSSSATKIFHTLPVFPSSSARLVERNNTNTKSTGTPTLETSWTAPSIVNFSQSLSRVLSRPTSLMSEAITRTSDEYSLETVESPLSSRVVSSSKNVWRTSVKVETSLSQSTISLVKNGSGVLTSEQFPTLSHLSLPYTPTPSLVDYSPSLSEAKFVTSLLLNKSSIVASKVSSKESRVSNSPKTFSELTPSESTITESTSAPTRANSSVVFNVSHSSATASTYGLPSTTVKPDVSKVSSSKMNSKMGGYSVIPIITPCYISYVITVTQRIVESSSVFGVGNISSRSLSSSTTAHQHSKDRSSSLTLQPTPITTQAVSYFTTESLSTSMSQTKSLSVLPEQEKSSLTLEVAPSVSSSALYYSSAGLRTTSNNVPTSVFRVNGSVPAFSSLQSPVSTWSISGNKSRTSLPVMEHTQSTTALDATPVMTSSSSIFYVSLFKPSTGAPQTTGSLTTTEKSFSMSISSSIVPKITTSFGYNNSSQATATVITSQSLDTWPIRSNGLGSRSVLHITSVVPTFSLFNTSSINAKISLKEKSLSTESMRSMQSSHLAIKYTASSSNITNTVTTHRSKETPMSLLPSSSKASACAISSLVKTTGVTLDNKTKNITPTPTLVNSYHVASSYFRNGTSSRSVESTSLERIPAVVSATTFISDTFNAKNANTTSDLAISVVSTPPKLVVNISKTKVPSYSLLKSSFFERLSSLQTSAVLNSLSTQTGVQNVSSTKPRTWLPSPTSLTLTTTVRANNYINETLHGFTKVIASSQGLSLVNNTPMATKSLFSAQSVVTTSADRSLKESDSLGMPATITSISNINSGQSSASNQSSVYFRFNASMYTTLGTLSRTIMPVAVPSIIPANHSNPVSTSLDAHLHSKTSSAVGQAVVSVTPSVNTSSLISTSIGDRHNSTRLTTSYTITSPSSATQVLGNYSDTITPLSLRKTTLPSATRIARRKRRDVQNSPLYSNSTSTWMVSDDVSRLSTSVIASMTGTSEIVSVAATMTKNLLSSSTAVGLNVKKSASLKPSRPIVSEGMSGTLITRTPSIGVSLLLETTSGTKTFRETLAVDKTSSSAVSNFSAHSIGSFPGFSSKTFRETVAVNKTSSSAVSNFSAHSIGSFPTFSSKTFRETVAVNKTSSSAVSNFSVHSIGSFPAFSSKTFRETVAVNKTSSSAVSNFSVHSIGSFPAFSSKTFRETVAVNKTSSSAVSNFSAHSIGSFPTFSSRTFRETVAVNKTSSSAVSHFSAHSIGSFPKFSSRTFRETVAVNKTSSSAVSNFSAHSIGSFPTFSSKTFRETVAVNKTSSSSVSNFSAHSIGSFPTFSSKTFRETVAVNKTSSSAVSNFSVHSIGSFPAFSSKTFRETVAVNKTSSSAVSNFSVHSIGSFPAFSSKTFRETVAVNKTSSSAVSKFSEHSISSPRAFSSKIFSETSTKKSWLQVSSAFTRNHDGTNNSTHAVLTSVMSSVQRDTVLGTPSATLLYTPLYSRVANHSRNGTTVSANDIVTTYTSSLKYLVTPSPSPLLTSTMKERLTATRSLSLVTQPSTEVISGIWSSHELASSSFIESVSLRSSKHAQNKSAVVSSVMEPSLSQLSPSSIMSTVNNESSRKVNSSAPTFTYYIISTSSLGKCIVGYSTLRHPNVTVEASLSTIATSRLRHVSSRDSLYSSLVLSSDSLLTSPIISSVTGNTRLSSFIVNMTVHPSSSPLLKPSRHNASRVLVSTHSRLSTDMISSVSRIPTSTSVLSVLPSPTLRPSSVLDPSSYWSTLTSRNSSISGVSSVKHESASISGVSSTTRESPSIFEVSSVGHESAGISGVSSTTRESPSIFEVSSVRHESASISGVSSTTRESPSIFEVSSVRHESASISGVSSRTRESPSIFEVSSVRHESASISGVSSTTRESPSIFEVSSVRHESASVSGISSVTRKGSSISGVSSVKRDSTSIPEVSSVIRGSASVSGIPSVNLITPTSSSSLRPSTMIPSSSVAVTSAPTSAVEGDAVLLIILEVSDNVDVTTDQFKDTMEEKLNVVYQKGRNSIGKRRRRRNTDVDSSVKVIDIKKSKKKVDVKYIVMENNKTVSAVDAAKKMNVFSIQTLGTMIGYDVLLRPEPAPKDVPTDNIVAMLVKTSILSNLSTLLLKQSFEGKLADLYNFFAKGQPRGQVTKATVTRIYFEPLARTYVEFVLTVDNVTVNQSIVQNVFALPTDVLTYRLHQVVLVAPYIPGLLNPTMMDYIIQTMRYTNKDDFNAMKNKLPTKLSRVYLEAKQKVARKRRKRALGSINAVIKTIRNQTKNFLADVTYYIIDGGSVLNATYACAILNRLTTNEMSRITTPFVVNTSPSPLQPTTSKTSDNDDDPPWLIIAILAGSVGLLLLIIIIILYCRWKKGAPSKKIDPGVTSPGEDQLPRPRMTHAADRNERPDLYRPPPRTSVSVEENGQGPSGRPPLRKLPVRENSVRKKVLSRESLIAFQTTRANPAFVGESGDESVTDASVVQVSRVQTRAPVRKKELELPRKQEPSPSVQETLESEEESETEASDYESTYTIKDSVFTDQQSVAIVPTIAVMTDTPTPQLQPPVRFRTSVHPETNLPPIDLKQTSLVGRVIEEEGPIQQQLKSKADIERWRNKQRQREKMQGESRTKPGNRPSFTEKKAWTRAQQEIGSALDPEAMQPIVRKKKRKPRRKYNMKTETTDDEENIELKGFHKLNSPREEKSVQREQESQSDSEISMGEARRRMITLLDDAFASMKSSSKKQTQGNTDNVDGSRNPRNYPSAYRPPLYPRPATTAPALPEPPPAHGRATAPSARHRRRFVNSQNSLPYPSHYYQATSGRYSPGYPPPPPPPVVTRNPVVVWDPADKQRLLNQSSYRPYPGHPYTYSDPSSKLHFTPVQRTPDGMGGLVWSPYATEYAMEDFYRNVGVPGAFHDSNSSFLSKMQETPLSAAPDTIPAPRDTVLDMGSSGLANEPGTVTGQSAEPLVRAIKDELFRLSTGRTPVKHL